MPGGEKLAAYQPHRHIYCAHRLNVKLFVISCKIAETSLYKQQAPAVIYVCTDVSL